MINGYIYPIQNLKFILFFNVKHEKPCVQNKIVEYENCTRNYLRFGWTQLIYIC